MQKRGQLVIFSLDDCRYALPLASVARVVRAVEVTPLPRAPEIVIGVINVRGRILPVVNLRRRFRLPEREPALTDQLIVAHTARRAVVLRVDAVAGVVEYDATDLVEVESILPAAEYVEGVVKLKDGIVLIHDLDKFLSLDEEQSLDRALGTV